MYTPVTTLRDIKEFLEAKLKEHNYTLQAAPRDGTYDHREDKQIIPPVRIAAMPHENFAYMPVGELFPSAPYILVSMDKSNTAADDRSMDVLIQCCVFSTENYAKKDGSTSNVPDELAEIDLLNLLEWIQQRIIEAHKIGGATVDYPIQMGSYGSKTYTYPKAYGYLSFSVNLIQPSVHIDWDKMY